MADVKKIVREALAHELQVDAQGLCGSTTFADCGLDSLSGLRFARRLEEELGITIELEWLFDSPTIDELARALDLRIDSFRGNGSSTLNKENGDKSCQM